MAKLNGGWGDAVHVGRYSMTPFEAFVSSNFQSTNQ